MVWACCQSVCNGDQISESPSASFKGVTKYEAVNGDGSQSQATPRNPFASATAAATSENGHQEVPASGTKRLISTSTPARPADGGPLADGIDRIGSDGSVYQSHRVASEGRLTPLSPQSDLLMSGGDKDVPRSIQTKATPERFLQFWRSARYHRAVDEQDLGPDITVPADADPSVQESLDFASHLSAVFEAIRTEIPEPIDEQRAVPDTPYSSERNNGSADASDASHSLTLRRTPTKLNQPIANPKWFEAQGFEDVSPHHRAGKAEVHAWLKIEQKRTYCSMDLLDLPFSVEELLPVICEFEQFPVWFPFLQSAEVLHDFPGSTQHIRMGRACLKLPVMSLESITIVCLEDRLRDCGCIGVYVFSPPEDIMMSKDGGEWMGAKVPGLPKSNFQIRLPFAWARTCIFPMSRNRTRIRAEAAVVNVVPPIHWVFRYSTREMAKRVPGMLARMVRDSKNNSIGRAAAERPDFYKLWQKRLEDFYVRQNM
mmetsp:Transcript_20411/g.37165  ORF Transcript_20411/g.37165 Transcript_20411/m.37165 type:complete len:486 (-) Transcript_20411:120-1577(-)